MNDTGKKLITAIDHSKIKEGQSIFKGDIYDADDNLIGPAPIKGAFTNQEAEEKIEPINEPPDLEEFGDNAEDFKDEFMDDKKEGCLKISSHLIKKYHVKTIRGLRMREAFIYKDGIYIPGEDVLRKEVRELLEEQCTIHYTKEIIEAIPFAVYPEIGQDRLDAAHEVGEDGRSRAAVPSGNYAAGHGHGKALPLRK